MTEPDATVHPLAVVADMMTLMEARATPEDLDELADTIAVVQHLKQRLGQVEQDLSTAMGKRAGVVQGNLTDGRQFTLKRTQDRKEWDHEDWKRDVRRTITERFAPNPDDVAVDAASGEAVPLRGIIQRALAVAQEVHGSTAPRSTSLKALGLYASDYCTSTPGGWKFTAIQPKPTTEEN